MADRFLLVAGASAIDLATGGTVLLRLGTSGGASDEARWAARCDRLHRLRHWRIAALVDFGAVGSGERFEAWQCDARWTGRADHAGRAAACAMRFFEACGLSAGRNRPTGVYAYHGRPVVVPDASSGYPLVAGREPAPQTSANARLEDCGLMQIDWPSLGPAAEALTSWNGSRPWVVHLHGPTGVGKTSAVAELARVARINGFVPLAAGLLERIDRRLLRDRSVCLLDDDNRAVRWRSVLMQLALVSAESHVVIATAFKPASSGSLFVPPLDTRALIGALVPANVAPEVRHRVEAAARHARGRLRVFRDALWPVPGPPRSGGMWAARVAEQAPTYVAEPARVAEWPAPADVATLRRQLDDAAELLARGRHTVGERQMRQAVAGLARREDWHHAGAGALALAVALRRRGRPQDAQGVLADGQEYARRGNDEATLVDVAVVMGESWIDRAQLDRAEAVLASVTAAARHVAAAESVARAALALARCLFWKGQFDEARALVRSSAVPEGPSDLLLQARGLAARLAVACGELPEAVALARDALEHPGLAGHPGWTVSACEAGAFVHLSLHDLDAAGALARRGVAAARAAADPLAAIRLRTLLAEHERRRGRAGTARALSARLLRVRAQLPAIVRARIDLAAALAGRSGATPDVAARQAVQTGLPALRLYAFDPPRPPRVDWDADELAELLRECQAARSERDVLGTVCARLRRALRASGVAFLWHDSGRLTVAAGDGARADGEIAARVLSAGIAIPPCRQGDYIEAAVPVVYGGDVLAALQARWPLGTPYDLGSAAARLTVASAAAAPVLATMRALSRRPPVGSALDAIVGVSPAIVGLRRAIEQAAESPFAVLIEGESGSGKELVARALHRLSGRRDRACPAVNCAAIPDELLEAELFGHARGAFTGAMAERVGVFEEAHGGTLFLDEVGELSLRAQAKLLRAIQEGEFRRVGENVSRRADVRLVSATNRDLGREAETGRFRRDLLYRLDVVRIGVPPLRERREDIALLAEHYWREAAERVGSRATLGAATLAALARYDWPGNVRELQNVLAALAVRSPRRGSVPPSALPSSLASEAAGQASRLAEARRTFDERFVRAALVRNGGHRGRAAGELGVTRQGLAKLMARLGIVDNERRPPTAD